ncbi:terminase [Synechococcales cyanobacterium C]|uniref:Terminase n=1 Tax=Petrachloros mirabilis ULC683 TaxID=2781853 RepID=A0A8K2A6I3_9CYAN|nr:terminase family protein [Petrachloros mirabilis]NCJ05195.1 terminase [Petrachloros mirabilis ULC683]
MASSSALTLYDYQCRWLADRSRFKIAMFARQTGKTFATTLEIVDDCFEVESQGRRTRWVILSRGERQAREAMQEGVRLHLQAYQMAADVIESEFVGESGQAFKQLEARLPGGSRIIALPANPDTARGYSGNVFLDEFAIHKNSRAIWGALFPVVSAGYKVRITSTPKGKANKFYELWSLDDPLWHKHRIDIHQAVREGLPRDVEELRRGLNDPDLWAQEYLCQFVDEASAWLSYDLINSCESPEAGDPDRYQGGDVYIGNDIARRNDLWVAWVLERVGDVLWTREIVTLRRATFAEQDATMDALFERYRVRRLAMDQTGMGEKPTEDAQRRYGMHRVEGILFTAANKQTLAQIGKQGFEDRKLRVPAGDLELRQDLHKLRKIVTPTGGVRFDADTDALGHADRAWACFLAQYAVTNTFSPIDYTPITPSPDPVLKGFCA